MEEVQETHEGNANYEFPNQTTYEFLTSILKLPKGKSCPGVLPNRKQFLQSSFHISIQDGKEVIIHRKTNKPLVVSEKANEIIQRFHQESHSGVNPTYLKIKEHYHHTQSKYPPQFPLFYFLSPRNAKSSALEFKSQGKVSTGLQLNLMKNVF